MAWKLTETNADPVSIVIVALKPTNRNRDQKATENERKQLPMIVGFDNLLAPRNSDAVLE